MAKSAPARADLLPQLAEVFRAHGYEGATLTLISEATGLGKGSLYHFFPGGKAQMATEVLTEIDNWFETNIFVPLGIGHARIALPLWIQRLAHSDPSR